jgi:hypothetical protein
VAANIVPLASTDPTAPPPVLTIDTVDWSAINWTSTNWDSIKWDSVGFDSVSRDFGDTAAVAEVSTENLSTTTTVVDDPTAVVSPDGTTAMASPMAPLS